MRLIFAVVCFALFAGSAFAQMGTSPPVLPKHTVLGHEIEENTLYYIQASDPPQDSLMKLVKLELCLTDLGHSTSWGSFAIDDRDVRPDLANSWMNIPGRAAQLRLTDSSPRFLIWTSKESVHRLRATRLKIKKDFRTVQLDPKDGHGNFFKEAEGYQIGQISPNAFMFAIKGPVKAGEYVIALGPQGPAVDFGIDEATSK